MEPKDPWPTSDGPQPGHSRGAGDGRSFPITVSRKGVEDVEITGPDLKLVLCNHGALALAGLLEHMAKHQYCDGARHGGEETMFVSSGEPWTKDWPTEPGQYLFYGYRHGDDKSSARLRMVTVGIALNGKAVRHFEAEFLYAGEFHGKFKRISEEAPSLEDLP